MKKIIIILAVSLLTLPGIKIQAQDVQARLDEAAISYKSEDLQDARFSLQEALNEINQVVGAEILEALPSEMNGMSKVDDEDNVTGANMGVAGLYVHRSYKGDSRDASIEILSDSPMMAGINTILTMPGFMTSDPNQKRIKVSKHKALLTRSTDDEGNVSYEVQVPFSSSMMTFQCSGVDDENEVVEMVNAIGVDRILEISE